MTTRLRLYESFRSVATEGGVTAAARAMHKVPSAVHHDIASLEGHLGCKLFERAGRRLVLTAEGRALLDVVSTALGDLERAAARLRAGHRELPLRVASVSGFGRYRLAPALLRSLPGERALQLEFGTHEAVVDAVRCGRVDCGVTFRSAVSAPLIERRVATERLVLVVSLAHSTAASELPLIGYEESDYAFACWLEATGRALPHRAYLDHFGELEEALESVACGRGMTVVPEDACFNGAFASRLKVIETNPVCENGIFALCLDAHEEVLDLIGEALAV